MQIPHALLNKQSSMPIMVKWKITHLGILFECITYSKKDTKICKQNELLRTWEGYPFQFLARPQQHQWFLKNKL